MVMTTKYIATTTIPAITLITNVTSYIFDYNHKLDHDHQILINDFLATPHPRNHEGFQAKKEKNLL